MKVVSATRENGEPMTDRERLLEILNKPIFPHESVDPMEAVADYLLDNGVTFATDNNVGSKWIPVAERLPEELPKAGSAWSEVIRPSVDVLVKIKGLKQLYTAWYSYSHNVWADVREEHNFTGVTHWMSLPEPPKEE